MSKFPKTVKKNRRDPKSPHKKHQYRILALFPVLFLGACSSGPRLQLREITAADQRLLVENQAFRCRMIHDGQSYYKDSTEAYVQMLCLQGYSKDQVANRARMKLLQLEFRDQVDIPEEVRERITEELNRLEAITPNDSTAMTQEKLENED